MKRKRKSIALAISLFMMVMILVACQKSDDAKPANENNKQEQTAATDELKTATKEDVEKALKDDKSLVVDARSNDQFNGWALDGDKRGGHIDGATDFSAYWIRGAYDEKKNLEGDSCETVLEYTMENKAIAPDKEIIVYDTNGKDAPVVAKYFKDKGDRKSVV